MQATIVEQLRVERADKRMQPPSLREEKTAVGGYGGMRTQDVVEGRDIDTVGMVSLYRLLELTGILAQPVLLPIRCESWRSYRWREFADPMRDSKDRLRETTRGYLRCF
jgi:hypothetical protein